MSELANQQQKRIRRNIEDILLETLLDTPVTVIQGARQVGKSTLAAMISDNIDCRRISLDDTAVLTAAKLDPLTFANQYNNGTLIVDEVQRCPELLRAIKLSVDENRRPGRFILTGSANLLHVSGANESLAGRAETIRLHPFSYGELEGRKDDFIFELLSNEKLPFLQSKMPKTRDEYAVLAAAGGYPDAVKRHGKRRYAWFQNYLASVLDHDAVDLSGLAHLDKLGTLFSVLSGQTSSEFVQRHVAVMTGIPESSLHGYTRLLHDLYLIDELPAWGRNISRRVISKRKVSLSDTGIASHINGLDETALSDVLNGEAFGSILESYVVSELFKQQTWSKEQYSLYHYRDKDRKEVDIVAELFNGRIVAIEVKASKSVSRSDFAGMKALRDVAGERFVCGIVLYTGEHALSYGADMYAAPVSTIW
jgi:predicted AAA+ superfamily ATPase